MDKMNLSKISDLKFKGKWRKYQQRVLDELKTHLNDSKLNIVAAPGAGKTTLGIEVVSSLNKPTLILTPTITIKKQWKQRIIEGFLDDSSSVEISDDLRQISIITISTYQALHSLMKDRKSSKVFIEDLKKYNIQTLVLDEAHHLRTEWYNSLEILCKKLKSHDFTVVSLTGTPPYDVSASEWNNYHSLCGPVDAEISVPELVKNGDLCPHQDLIYFSNITDDEKKIVLNFEKNREEFYRYIIEKPEFLYLIQTSDFIANYEQNLDLLYKNSEFTVSIISYLLNRDSLNMQAHIITEFLGLSVDKIPNFTYEIAQILVNGMLGKYSENFKNTLAIKNKLKELKLIKARTVDLVGEVNLKKLCARSINKLNAIEEITKFEYKSLSNNLREVILLDYIGRGDSVGLNIYSVFDKLYPTNISLCILTGTVIVIPVIAKEKLYELLSEKEISKDKVFPH